MLFDLVRVRVLSTGTGGPLELGGADGGGRTFAAAGIEAGTKISYGIADGAERETGTGIFDGINLTRNFRASTTGSPINLTGNAVLEITPNSDDLNDPTGWAAYVHTGAAQAVAANTDTRVLNNAGTKIETQMPYDVTALYDGTHVVGRSGDSITVGTELTFTPDDGTASNLTLTVNIGGAVGHIYPRDFALIRGAGVAHRISYYPPAYTLDTWQANGGAVTINVDGPGVVSAVRFVIHRLHKAR